MWQPKKPSVGLNVAGPSGLKNITDQEEGMGLLKNSSVDVDRELGPSDGNSRLDQNLGPTEVAGPSVLKIKEVSPLQNSGPIRSPVMDPVLSAGSSGKGVAKKTNGSGFYDVSKNVFGSQVGPTCNTTNSFGTLRDEEDCFDTDLGMWEHEIEMVKKFVETSTRPKIEEYSSWSENMRKYYDGLTKVNGDEAEVESDTGETTQFMNIGSKF
ncbi:hypothetical protein HanLR1_Chr08g0280761 [Helianthus annuus]|nr:hypothetical protein HanLR1_Chr08g0280761 [Helianthus annuus]